MKRTLLLISAAALILAPLASRADYRDGKDCRESEDTTAWADVFAQQEEDPTNPDNADRGSYCVRAGGTTVFYLGGETSPEQPGSRGFQGLCGVIIVADTSLGSGHPDSNADPDDWNWEHTHADGSTHKHDCN